jgi:hypothetical protein
MSNNDIANMSILERVSLMEELWSSFEKDGLEYPTPKWHEEILNQRASKDSSHFISFDEAKKSLYEDLNAYRNT